MQAIMQALQPVHLSAMTFKAGLCLTVFNRAQGRREMTRDGSSTCNSASIAGRDWVYGKGFSGAGKIEPDYKHRAT